MTETFYRTGNHKVNYSSFGGIIQLSDFYTNYTNGNIAERIVSHEKEIMDSLEKLFGKGGIN